MHTKNDSPKRKNYTFNEAFVKIQKWCAYQERSQYEVRNKLYELRLSTTDVENIIVNLIATNFLNEERFAKAFVSGKFKIKKWGKIKIKTELRKKKVSEQCIKKALTEIDLDEYYSTLKKLYQAKLKTITEKHPLKKKYKLMQYLISKGFESDLIHDVFKEA